MKIRIPAEWEEQEALIVVFPPKQSDWAHSIEEIHQTYLTFITTIARFQKCMVICEDKGSGKFTTNLAKHRTHPNANK